MRHTTLFPYALAVALATGAASADTVRLAGSTTLVNAVITPHRERIEKSSGHSLQIVASATGKGLVELADRNADVAMISSTLETALLTAEIAGKKIDPSTLRVHDLRPDEIVFLVNASNPVSKLSAAQLGDIHTGKLSNWKQVGGKDLPITIYTSTPQGATSAVVKKTVMGGAEYPAGVKIMTSFPRIADLIPGDEGGIGALGRGFVKADGKAKLIDTVKVMRPLALVTLGEPSPKVRQVIDALRAAATNAAGPVEIAVLCATQVKPEMPRKASQEGAEGVVRAQALIRDGIVKEVTILSGPRIFHAAVREAMLQYKCTSETGDVLAPQEFVFRN
ncbi:MAG: substrate-binding domain-containing protein [Pseudomonadota bacterium]|nr:substrate-binding domain-containing protein [Pseudomonadota bacterium]